MARKRCLSGSISTSQKVNEDLRRELAGKGVEFTQLLYTWLIPHCNDWGQLEANIPFLKARVMPMSARGPAAFETALRALHNVRLVMVYVAEGRRYLQILQWEQHQDGLHKRTLASLYPAPIGGSYDLKGGFRFGNRNFPEFPGNSLERNGTERNRTVTGISCLTLEEKTRARATADGWADELRRGFGSAAGAAFMRENGCLYNLAAQVVRDALDEDAVRRGMAATIEAVQHPGPDGKPFVKRPFGYLNDQVERFAAQLAAQGEGNGT